MRKISDHADTVKLMVKVPLSMALLKLTAKLQWHCSRCYGAAHADRSNFKRCLAAYSPIKSSYEYSEVRIRIIVQPYSYEV
jgi:hypothetical protein